MSAEQANELLGEHTALEEPPSRWREPPLGGFTSSSFRLGDNLWSGKAGLEPAPQCDFFPRQLFGALALPPAKRGAACSLLLLGGTKHGRPCNDVWRLSVPRLGAQRFRDASGTIVGPKWTEVSPVDLGTPGGHGIRIMRKWPPRSDFGCCAARSIIYVAGGQGTAKHFNDVWASDDLGTTWACMNPDAPWIKRTAPGLYAVPERAGLVLLAGGMMGGAEVSEDAWISEDAGSTWTQLARPLWSTSAGRYRSAMLPLPPRNRVDSEVRVLMLGGLFIDGGGGGYGGLERLLHDAWECNLDTSAVTTKQAATWKQWGAETEDRGRLTAQFGVESATVTIDLNSDTLIARLPEKNFVFVAEARCPKGDYLHWHQIQLESHSEILASGARPLIPNDASEKMVYVRMAESRHTAVPRLAFVDSSGVRISSDGEWRRHARFGLLLGARLERDLGFPGDLWRGRVMPSLLPAVLPAARSRSNAS